MEYAVPLIDRAFPIDAAWDKPPWSGIEPLTIARVLGPEPAHRPRTQAKLAYDRDALYVIFRVEDRYVRVVNGHQGAVCRDSCVELFFTPGTDVSQGYFNIEMNAGGHMLFHFQKIPRRDDFPVADADCERLTVAHTLPERVEPEMPGPVTWIVEYRLPVEILERYMAVVRPAPGVEWRANLYKCGDQTSHPHWLTWAPVDGKIDYHQPRCFGSLRFLR